MDQYEYAWQSAIPDSKILISSHRRRRYSLGEPINPAGHWSATFLAEPKFVSRRAQSLAGQVAVKIQIAQAREPASAERIRAFRFRSDSEFESLQVARALHPAIVNLIDWGTFPDRLDPEIAHRFLVLEYLRGGTLERALRKGGQWNLHDKLHALYLMSEGVERLHRLRILHGNLNIGNVILKEPDNLGSSTIIDFSFARRIKSSRLNLGEMDWESKVPIGTPTRRPPEYIRPDLFPLSLKADVYGLGQIFTALLWSIDISDGIGKLHEMRTKGIGSDKEMGTLTGYGPPSPPEKERVPIYHLVTQMLSTNPAERPTVEDVRYQIRHDYPGVFGDSEWKSTLRKSGRIATSWAGQAAKRVRASLFRQDK